MNENPSGTTFHIAAGSRCSTTVGEVVDSGIEYFKRKSSSHSMKKVRFIQPQVADIVMRLLPARQRQALEKMRFFDPYICIAREFDTTNTQKALKGSGISPPALASYFENIMDFCTVSQWGEKFDWAA
jgi:hypothetical protein